MATLNRFPLLALWAKEAAHRLGYTRGEAQSLGHAYAVLYAIRAAAPHRPKKGEEAADKKPRKRAGPPPEYLQFGGDQLEITHDGAGRVRGRVGGAALQTPHSYEVSVRDKFPPGWYDRLERSFRSLLRSYPPRTLRNARVLYDVYDQWKKACAVGRLVDLGELLEWCDGRRHKGEG
jgi:hypothetical protein